VFKLHSVEPLTTWTESNKTMNKSLTLSIFALILFLASCPTIIEDATAQTPNHTANSKDTKPADPGFILTRDTFDCTAMDTFSLNPDTIITLADSTINSVNLLSTYSCRSWREEGPENIYRLDVLSDLELFAGLRDLDAIDLDIFLLDDCDTEACIASDNTEFTIVLAPGTYYLVVDGYGTGADIAGSTYTLLLDCRWLGIPASVCQDGGATAVTCATSLIPWEAQLFEKPNLVQSYDCSQSILRGGEQWFAITLEPMHGFTVSTTFVSSTVDQALWLFDGCGTEATCLGYADEKTSGQGETLSFTNELETQTTVYLATDSFRAVGDEFEGAVSLEFDCASFVATVPVNMGSLRARFR
jgi:hypothetical protein